MAIGSFGSVEGFRGIAAVPRSHYWISGGAQRGNEGVEDMPDSSRSSPVCWASLVKCSVHPGSASNIYMFKAHPLSCVLFLSSRTTLVRHEEGDSSIRTRVGSGLPPDAGRMSALGKRGYTIAYIYKGVLDLRNGVEWSDGIVRMNCGDEKDGNVGVKPTSHYISGTI